MPRQQYGFKAAGELRPRPKLRRYYLRKANRQAKRLYAPERRVYRNQLERLRTRRQRQLQSVGGAVDMFNDVIASAQEGLKGSGLKGKYRAQVAGELANRQADVAASTPFLRSQVRQEFAAPLSDLRQQIVGSRIDQQREAQQRFTSFLAGGMEEAQPVLAKRQQRQRAQARGGEDGRLSPEMRTALRTTEVLHSLALATPEGVKAYRRMPDEYWLDLEYDVGRSEGVNPLQARRAVAMFRQQFEAAGQRGVGAGFEGVLGGAAAAAPQPVNALLDLLRLARR